MKKNDSISSSAMMPFQQTVHAFQSMLLSIYDEVMITDINGMIRERAGEMKGLWEVNEDTIIGSNLFELEKNTFFGEPSIQNLLNQQKTSIIQTSWHDKKILVTGYPLSSINTDDLLAWGFRNITEDPSHNEGDPYAEDMNHVMTKYLSTPLVVRSQKMLDVFDTAEMVSKVPSTVLLLGESGVGKEMIAKSIHEMGHRKAQPFIAVNCGAIPENLLESELFGYEEGAFSGARKNGASGKFELANHGVLFLDEVAELPLNLQVKLLRVLQEREVTPLGGSKPIKINIQVIAATNTSLEQMVEDGTFREDLYYRLNVVPIEIPSLRERIEEIPYFIYHFVQKYNQLYNRNIQILPDAIDLLSIYKWPGNVRQLENIIERIVVTSRKTEVDAPSVQNIIPWKKDIIKAPPIFEHIMPLQEAMDLVEEQLINMAMEQYKSVKLAAKVLDVSQPTMSRKYKKIRKKMQQANLSPSNKRKILEEQLDIRLRSIAIVTAAIIQPEEVIQLKTNTAPTNPDYQKLQKKLTMIREQEGIIEWVYIFYYLDNKRMLTLVADEGFIIKPGETYEGPPEIMDVASAAMNGKVGVTPMYKDIYGEWKTSFAPIFDHSGQVIALIGYDYSQSYINSELKKLAKILNINI
ncbi:sigma-54 interaction domain-containing protein [Pseudalkalibacillus decolorationis]|uniref:sigma-54 interaction domain-containing protein n=1 Tax=Pseudalkalibacillus decolorationis TaxID=163879 RepID=UPI0021492097|nr:sigma 54-interacting transcriptional regulator [Pseudalkalibacillus decolorationis]